MNSKTNSIKMDTKQFNEDRYYFAKMRVKRIKGFYVHAFVYLAVNIFLVLLNSRNLHVGETYFKFENFYTAFFWGIGLLAHAISVFGLNFVFGRKWEEKKLKEFMEKEERTQDQRWE